MPKLKLRKKALEAFKSYNKKGKKEASKLGKCAVCYAKKKPVEAVILGVVGLYI